MTGQKTQASKQPLWQRIFEHVESYPSIQTISHTIMVFTFCVTAVFLSTAATNWKAENIKLEIKQAELKKDIELAKIAADAKKAESEARKQEAIAASNPYKRLAESNTNKTPITLNINAPGYEVGKSDAETEVNLQPIKVNGRKYNSEQRRLMTLAYHVGSEIGFPETIQSILIVETRAGKFGNRIGDTNLPPLKRSYGVMQVKAGTTRQVLRLHPDLVQQYFPGYKSEKKLRDEEIIIKSITDDVFNIKVAALYFAHQRKYSKGWSTAVVAYNQGLGRARQMENPKEHVYYKKIVGVLIKEVRPFNESVGLSVPKK